MLGILTVPTNLARRNSIRKSWLKDVPSNVCYAFLYDKREYIPQQEQFDGISLNASHEGYGVRFAEKLFRYYSYVVNNTNLKYVKYIVKMDDDVVLCPKQLFEYLDGSDLTEKSYAGWFHEMNTWNSQIDSHHRSDEMFVLLGRDLVTRIASKTYCEHEKKSKCDSLGQLYDTGDWAGTSLGVWLSQMKDINPLPMNDVFDHYSNYHYRTKERLKPENTLLFHPARTPEKVEEKYQNCQKIRLA